MCEVLWSPRQNWTNDTILHEKMAGTKKDKQKYAFIWMAKFATNQHSSHISSTQILDKWKYDWLTPGGKVGFETLKQFILPFIFILKWVFSPFSFRITQYRVPNRFFSSLSSQHSLELCIWCILIRGYDCSAVCSIEYGELYTIKLISNEIFARLVFGIHINLLFTSTAIIPSFQQ